MSLRTDLKLTGPWPPAVGLVVQAALVTSAALLYFGVRGLTEGGTDTAVANGLDILEFERRLGIDIEASVHDAFLGSDVLTMASNWVYIYGHWPAIVVTLVWLYKCHPGRYLLLRNAMFVSGAIGLVIFATYPVAPPRLLPDELTDGAFVDTVTELSRSYRVLQPPALVNKYAAMPSLHAGWNLLLGVVIVYTARRVPFKLLGLGGPVLMAIAVVTTANHYVLDVVVGCAVAMVGLAVSRLIQPHLYGRVFAGPHHRGVELGEQVEVVEDQPGDAPPGQLDRPAAVLDGPGEEVIMAGAQLEHEPAGEQALVDHDAAEPARRAQPAQQEELEPVSRRAQGADPSVGGEGP